MLLPTTRLVRKVCVVPGANVTVKLREFPGARVGGNWLKVNGVFGLFVVVSTVTSVCGFKAAASPLVRVKEITTVAVVRTFPKLMGAVALGCRIAPEHCAATLLLQESGKLAGVPDPVKIPMLTGKPAMFACR